MVLAGFDGWVAGWENVRLSSGVRVVGGGCEDGGVGRTH